MIDWKTIDNGLLDPNFYVGTDYHAAFTQMRDEDPVRWVRDERYGKDYWAITRHEDVSEVLKNAHDFSSRWNSRIPLTPKRVTPEERHKRGVDVRITELDFPMHDLYRRPINKHFTVPQIEKMRQGIEQMVDDIIDSIAAKGECDLVEDIAAALPTRVTLEMVGVPKEDWDYITEASWQFMSSGHPRWMIDNDPVKTYDLGQQKLLDYCTKLALDRRENPKDDFATIIGELEIDGEKLSIHEMKSWFVALIGGGLETTRNAVAVGLWELMRQPEQRKMLAENPSLTSSTVEEILRWVTPTKNKLRIASRDFEFRGKRIKRGDWVGCFLVSANRDDRVFDNAQEFDIRRDPNPHLAFGHGPHVCLGRPLARMELATIVPRVLKAFPDMHTTVTGPAWLADTSVTGFTELPVAYTPVRVPARTRA
ncbi:cytochrome P450 [Paenarthrobacter sp. RAF54_2]|uniref:cytochrome P450 n=1 Tax=Paenarthrobacter sp. RAF54_2 TaxID=3233061 RepID=UPI003F98C527